ncbi:MAG: response regulator [Candidatus Sumerlaeia bacterium]|nr:response regulator [Candidatus Sumerlaeia bacterium]
MGDRFRVMVVDDDADIRELLRVSLSAAFEVVEARNGLDAVLKLKYQPDIAVVDIMMPIMNGHDLIRKIRTTEGFADMPILALSALNQRSDIKAGYDAGANLYLTKPFQPERVIRNLGHLLEGRTPRAKDQTLEEIENRERIQEAHLQRALQKKKEEHEVPLAEAETTPSRETPPQGTPRAAAITPPPERQSSSSVEILLPHQLRKLPRPSGDAHARQNYTPPPEETPLPPSPLERLTSGEHHTPAIGSPRVLLVDDDEDFLVITRSMLEEHYEVITAHDGFEALNKVPEVEPDIFIIDGMMPKMSGYQLIDMLKGAQETHFRPIIFCSARGSDRDRRLVEQKGVRHYLVKPFSPARLLGMLDEIVADPSFIVADKKRSYKDILYEEGVRRAAHMTAESRKRRWETYDTLEKFLKDTVNKDKK